MKLPAIFRKKEAKSLTSVDSRGSGGWFNILEPWSGAWQSLARVDGPKNVLAFSAVYACVTIIAGDVAKLGIDLMKKDAGGIGEEVTNSPFLPVLRRPNGYQTRLQFIQQWVVSKLLHGNTYALKQRRDMRGLVTALHILDPQRVTPLITEEGDIYYRLARDELAELGGEITVPASEIIHDRMVTLWHPLVGVSPLYACGIAATLGNRIQSNSTRFFGNMSRPSGGLTAPGTISDETAARLKAEFEKNFSGENIGRLFVAGDGLKYEAMAMPAQLAQLIEQLKFTVEDVARSFHMPLFKLGGTEPVRTSVESLNQTYFQDCLQFIIESLESSLDDGLELPAGLYTECDLDGLLRMDTAARYTAKSEAVKGGWMSPDEARAGEDLKPVPGGDTPYLQQQNYSLGALAKRDAKPDPFVNATPARRASDGATPAAPASEPAAARALLEEFSEALFERMSRDEDGSSDEDEAEEVSRMFAEELARPSLLLEDRSASFS